jgi:DNA (cytosine-5)-methyltransferase 1
VVRGPDLIWGERVEDFTCVPWRFDGIVGGSPCQDFSRARRSAPSGQGKALIEHFLRVVCDSAATWFLLENVPSVPDVSIEGYQIQRLNLEGSDCGMRQRRNRCFQFGTRDATCLVLPRKDTPARATAPTCMATEGKRTTRRQWSDFCQLQGLPADFDLPGWSLGAKYSAVGNGVPIPMARVIAAAIRDRQMLGCFRTCACDCGRLVDGQKTYATPACRKRMERRRRVTAGEDDRQPVTEAEKEVAAIKAWRDRSSTE